jgi:hypothetical protein
VEGDKKNIENRMKYQFLFLPFILQGYVDFD